MNRSRVYSQQSMRKNRSRITRYKSLEISGVTAKTRSDYGAKEMMQFISTNCGSSIENEASDPSSQNSQQNSSSSSETLAKRDFDDFPRRRKFSITGLREIVPSRFLASGTDLISSDEDRNIVAMPIEVTTVRNADRDIKRLVYEREAKERMKGREKNHQVDRQKGQNHQVHGQELKHHTVYGQEVKHHQVYGQEVQNDQGYGKEAQHHQVYEQVKNHQLHGHEVWNQLCLADKNLTKPLPTKEKDKEDDRGCKLSKMIPDGSYIISKENYIISNQARLPNEIIAEGQIRTDILRPGIAAGSVSEVVDGSKIVSITTVCFLAFALALTCIGWYIFYFNISTPTAVRKKPSLLRYLLEQTYEALLDIYV